MPLHVVKDLSHLWQESYMVFCLQITNKFFPCSFRLIHHLSHDHAHPLEQDFYSFIVLDFPTPFWRFFCILG